MNFEKFKRIQTRRSFFRDCAGGLGSIEDELLGRTLVEVLVPLRGFVERDHGDVHRLGNLNLVIENRLHQPAVVSHHRALASGKEMGFGPPQPDANAEPANFGGFVHPARVTGDVQTRLPRLSEFRTSTARWIA